MKGKIRNLKIGKGNPKRFDENLEKEDDQGRVCLIWYHNPLERLQRDLQECCQDWKITSVRTHWINHGFFLESNFYLIEVYTKLLECGGGYI